MLRDRRAGQARRGARGLPQVGRAAPPRSARSPTAAGSTVDWHGELDRRRPAAHRSPTRARSTPGRCASPADLILLQADRAETLPRPRDRRGAARDAAAPSSPARTCADKTWVTEQYDRYVRGNTVLAQPEDAGVVRIDEQTGLGIALSVDGNGRFARLDPYDGAQLALAEAYRNVAVTGAKPLAVTNCLNFGSPGGPGGHVAVRRGRPRPRRRLPRAGHPGHRRQRQLLQPDRRRRRSTRRRSSACSACIDDVGRRVPMRLRRTAGETCSCCSARPATELPAPSGRGSPTGTSAACRRAVDLAARAALGELLAAARPRAGCVSSAHDLSDGGLAQALVESACGTASAPASRCRTGRPVRRAVQRVGRPRRSSRRPTRRACGRPAACGRRAGHRAGDDGRRRARRRRPARAAAGRAARGLDGDAAGPVRHARG